MPVEQTKDVWHDTVMECRQSDFEAVSKQVMDEKAAMKKLIDEVDKE